MDHRVRNRLLGSDLDETLQHSEGAKAFLDENAERRGHTPKLDDGATRHQPHNSKRSGCTRLAALIAEALIVDVRRLMQGGLV